MMDEHNRLQVRYYRKAASRTFHLSSLGSHDNRNAISYIRLIMEFLRPALADNGYLLEIGTGTGFHGLICTEVYGARYIGCDVSVAQLRQAQARFQNAGRSVMLLCCEGEHLPFRRGCISAAYMSGTLHHVSDPVQCLAECGAILKDGARLALMEPNPLFPSNAVFGLAEKVERNMFKMTLKNLMRYGAASGFRVVAKGYHTYTPPVPLFLQPLYDWIDRIAARIPILKNLSVMLYCFLVKPEPPSEFATHEYP